MAVHQCHRFAAPVLAVCGATGTGKSKLAIDLARVFGGEVINVDAMQLYEGLNIATNKVTSDEANGIPHHLLGTFPASWAGRIDVRDYRDRCLPLIDTIRENKHIPILAGGTHYYLESVLWSDFSAGLNQTVSNNIELQTRYFATYSNECYAQLKQINPSMAAKLHPNNVRKVRRALAEALMRQNSSEQVTTTEPIRARPDDGPPNRSYQPRYPGQTLIFWTDCDGEVLNTRLDQRVDSMIEAGLVHELDQFVTRFFSSYEDHVTTESAKLERLFGDEARAVNDPFVRRGILQSIGFKEFADYLALPAASERASPVGQQLLSSAIDRVKIATRQYARRQVRWITNRFLRRPATGGLPVYRIPVTEILLSECPSGTADWDRLVLAPAVRVVHNHLTRSGTGLAVHDLQYERLNTLLALCSADQVPQPCPFISETDPTVDEDLGDGPPFICTACCNRMFSRLEDWRAHRKSRSHQKRMNKLRKQALIQSVICDDADE